MADTMKLHSADVDHPLPAPAPNQVNPTVAQVVDLQKALEYLPLPGFEDSAELCAMDFAERSGGLIGSKGFRAKPGVDHGPSPWHVHDLSVHIVVPTRGTVRTEIEGIGEVEFKAGQPFWFPPRCRHRSVHMSPDHAGFEITVPAHYSTTFFIWDEELGAYRTRERSL